MKSDGSTELPNAEQVKAASGGGRRGSEACICRPQERRWSQGPTRYAAVNWRVGDCAVHGKRAARKAARAVPCGRCGAVVGESCRTPITGLEGAQWGPGPGWWVHSERAVAWYALVREERGVAGNA